MLNIISVKNPTENSSCSLRDTVSPWKPEKNIKTRCRIANSTPPACCEFANSTSPACRDFDTPKKNFIQTNNINGEMSQHSKSSSDVQLKNKLNIVISKKVRKLNLEKQVIDIRKSYHQNHVKLNSNACEATATNHRNNLQPSGKENQIN